METNPLRAQLLALAVQSAGQRESFFGVPVVYKDKKFKASSAGRSYGKKLEDGGYDFKVQGVARINKTNNPGFTPIMGERITIDGEEFRIGDVADHPTNPEWKIVLKSVAE